MECGYDAQFASEIDMRFQCPICLLAMRSPIQTACGHRFCNVCIKNVIPYKNAVLTCPVDKTYTKVSQMFPDVATEREILSLSVQCTNITEECTWLGELRELEKHRTVCQMEKVSCGNGCKMEIKRMEVDDHKLTCPHRLVQCQHCERRMSLHKMKNHEEKCPKFPIMCSLCNEMSLPREELAKHQDPENGQCSKAFIKCPYSYIGCEFQTERQKMAEHTQASEALHEHMNLTLKWMIEQGRLVQDLSQSVYEVEKSSTAIPLLLKNDRQHNLTATELRERNVTGKLHWKLKLVDTRQRNISYTSPAIYTGCPGYKIQLMLDLEGSREGSTRYTSLSLALLSGDYDNEVIFPFNATCIVTLYDQMKCPPQQKAHTTSQLVIREVPRNSADSSTIVERIYKREISKYIKRVDLVGPYSRYLRNGCLHFEVTVIHSYYPPADGVYHSQGCCYPAVVHRGNEMIVSPKHPSTMRRNTYQAQSRQMQSRQSSGAQSLRQSQYSGVQSSRQSQSSEVQSSRQSQSSDVQSSRQSQSSDVQSSRQSQSSDVQSSRQSRSSDVQSSRQSRSSDAQSSLAQSSLAPSSLALSLLAPSSLALSLLAPSSSLAQSSPIIHGDEIAIRK